MGLSLPTFTLNANKRIIRFSFALAFCLGVMLAANAQTGSVGIGTSTPKDNAILDITSNKKGLLIPRLLTSEANDLKSKLLAISNPNIDYNGLFIYNTDDKKFKVWKDIDWEEINGSVGAQGLPGATWYSGNINLVLNPLSEPAGSKLGDLYLNAIDREVYKKQSGGWVLTANLTVGTPGKSVKDASINTEGKLVLEMSDGTFITTSQSVKGDAGIAGLSIKSAAVVTDSLRITMSDNSIINAGKVKGTDGLSVKAATVVTDSLRITLSDNSVINAGKVKGTDGLGVKAATVVTDSLRITLTDNSIINAGKVKGTDGLGVKSAAVVTDSLRITLSDNSVINAGKVKGADGLGVKAAAVVTDSLRITLTDNSVINAGKVKGADGLGVKSAAVVTDSLRITLSDNSVINAGKVKGADGAPGSKWYAGTTNPDLNPSVASAIDGDMYFNGTTNTIWEKIGGTWTDSNIEINPTNAWSLKGNVGTTVPPEGVIADVISDFIGTADNTDFVIGTYSKEVIRVKTGGGNVGIGTSNPGAKLDVQGTAVIGVGGSIINKVLRKQFTGASSKAIPSLTKGASTTITFSMTGAAANGTAAISPTSFVPLPEGIIIGYARVASAGDNVEVKFYNVGTSDYVNLGTTYSFVVTVIQ